MRRKLAQTATGLGHHVAFIIAVCVCVWIGERSPAYRRHTTEPLTERRALRERERETPAITLEVTARQDGKLQSKVLSK